MMDIASKMQGMEAPRAQFLGAGLGFDEGTVNVLMRGPAALRAMRLEQEKLNSLSERDTDAALAREKSWKELAQAAEDLGRKILTDITPALTTLAEIAKEVVGFFKANVRLAEALGVAVGALGAIKFAGLLSGIASVSGALGGAVGLAATLVRSLGVLGLAGAAGYAFGNLIGLDKVGEWLGGKLYDAFNGPGPSMSGSGGAGPSAGSGSSGPAARQPRGIRLNNPGLLNFAGQAGATKEGGPGGRFAVFPSMLEGVAAMAGQLQRYSASGVNTVASIISKWAPQKDSNNTAAYIASVSKRMGVGPNELLDLQNIEMLRGLMSGISTVENGPGRVSAAQINAGIALARSRPGGRGSNSSSTDVAIGNMNIYTQATDAPGIAKSIQPALTQYTFVAQSNSGLN
jgi:hypothetical protein